MSPLSFQDLALPETRVFKIDPTVPDMKERFRFEWHPLSRKVYLINLPPVEEQLRQRPGDPPAKVLAECVAEHVNTHALAIGFVQTFCRGYRKAQVMAGTTTRPVLAPVT